MQLLFKDEHLRKFYYNNTCLLWKFGEMQQCMKEKITIIPKVTNKRQPLIKFWWASFLCVRVF